MSRLSRFKKPPVVKLSTLRKGKNDDSSDDEDDDFKTLPTRQKVENHKTELDVIPPKLKKEVANLIRAKPVKKKEDKTADNSSFSEYFPVSNNKGNQSKAAKKTQSTLMKQPNSCSVQSCSVPNDEGYKTAESEDVCTKPMSEDNNGIAAGFSVKEEKSTNASLTPVFCPFCMKKLNDKLNGITHIKGCAKGLPIEKIYEAILLQEKQIEEWKTLGLDFPSIASTDNKRGRKADSTSKAVGRRRKKKDDGADPNLELALALSVSLHEEVESRKQQETAFLIETGLENEIGLEKNHANVVISTSKSITLTTETKSKATVTKPRSSENLAISNSLSTATTTTRRRGKKIVYENLPVATVDDAQKKNFIARELTKVYESANINKEDFYVRDALPPGTIGVPKSLESLYNTANRKWKATRCDLNSSSEIFKVKGLLKDSQITALKSDHVGSTTAVVEEAIDGSKGLPNNNPNDFNNILGRPRAQLPEKMYTGQKSALVSPVNKTGSRKFAVSPSNEGHSPQKARPSKDSTNNMKNLHHLPPTVQDFARMLLNQVACDLYVYGREEKPIKCHTFIFHARCPRLLDEVVVEEQSNSDKTKNIIALTNYTHEAIKVFLWYLYTGSLESTEENVLIELEELASEYKVVINEDFKLKREMNLSGVKGSKVTCGTSPSNQNQLEQRSSIGPSASIADPKSDIEIENSKCNKTTGTNLSTTAELFSTFYDKEEDNPESNVSHLIEMTADNAKEVGSPIENGTVEDNISNYSNESVDLFEEEERNFNNAKAEVERTAQNQQESVENLKASPLEMEVSYTSSFRMIDRNLDFNTPRKNEENVNGVASEKQDYLKELLTPGESQFLQFQHLLASCERKRSRSVSPLPLPSPNSSLFSATQAAEYMQKLQDGRYSDVHVSDVESKTKRQKLDFEECDINDAQTTFENNDTNVIEIDFNDKSKYKLYENDTISASLVNKYFLPPNVTPLPKRASLMRSVSTPNLVEIADNTFSPIFYQQCNDDNNHDFSDPFANGDIGDSVFANIPDEVFNNPSNNPSSHTYESPVWKEKKDSIPHHYESSSTPSSSRAHRRLSPRNLSSVSSNLQETKKSKNNAGKSKSKSQVKLKLPKTHLPISEDHNEDFSKLKNPLLTSTPMAAEDNPKSGKNSKNTRVVQQSPMLNYSLIDTPILKQELKRYGIKPLPRSKAKVLLRHIYKETHN